MTALQKTEVFPEPHGDQRAQPRRTVLAAAVLAWDGHALDCTIHDLHEKGARIGFARTIPLPNHVFLINLRERVAHACVVAWRRDLQVGLEFRHSLALSDINDLSLIFLKKLWISRATR